MVTYEIFFGALFSFLVVGIGAFLWILSEFRAMRREFREENQRTREELRLTREELREEIRINSQRILEALYFHRHDSDGAAIFYPPTPATPAPPAD